MSPCASAPCGARQIHPSVLCPLQSDPDRRSDSYNLDQIEQGNNDKEFSQLQKVKPSETPALEAGGRGEAAGGNTAHVIAKAERAKKLPRS